jgi:ABC-type sugar transport system ATPase subunit
VLTATVIVVEPLGHVTLVHVQADDQTRLVAAIPGRPDAVPGDLVGVRFATERLHLFAPDGRRR